MLIAFQILLMLIMFCSAVLAIGDDEKSDRSAKIFAASLAAMLVTIFMTEGGII